MLASAPNFRKLHRSTYEIADLVWVTFTDTLLHTVNPVSTLSSTSFRKVSKDGPYRSEEEVTGAVRSAGEQPIAMVRQCNTSAESQ